MLCEHCHKRITIKRHLFNFFEKSIHHICEHCYQKYPLLPSYEVIPKTQGLIHLWTLMRIRYPVHPRCYQSFLKPYILTFLRNKKDKTLLIFDTINEDLFYLLNEFSFDDLFIIKHYENSHDKGEEL